MKTINLLFTFFACTGLSAQHVGIDESHQSLVQQFASFNFVPFSKEYFLLKKKAINQPQELIKNHGFPYRYGSTINDRSYSFLLPVWLSNYSFSFGNDQFLTSFESVNDSSADCIVLSYEFVDGDMDALSSEDFFNHQPREQSAICCYKNARGMFVGELAVGQNMVLSYYTNNQQSEQQLRACLISFKFE